MDAYFENQKKLHQCHIILLEEIKRLCNAHGLKYYAIAGTLLGAVRHKGPIPWDDDMDIGMMREDYEQFLQIAKEELSNKMFLQNFNTDEGYGLNFSKLLLLDTVMVERNASDSGAYKCIYVDIFPLDNAPDDADLREKQNRSTYFLKRLLLAKQGYRVYSAEETKKKIVYSILGFMSAFLSKEKIYAMLDASIRKYDSSDTERIVNVGGAYGYHKETLLRRWFADTVDLPFEGTTISAPADWVGYLTYFYGDYMTPPPENKRGDRHSIVKLDFGPYA